MTLPLLLSHKKSTIRQDEFADYKIEAAQAGNLHVKRSMDM